MSRNRILPARFSTDYRKQRNNRRFLIFSTGNSRKIGISLLIIIRVSDMNEFIITPANESIHFRHSVERRNELREESNHHYLSRGRDSSADASE